jgi:NAD(P)-dependent dehydrogenase (short-subunit alcohol dehydrogenase family)
LSQVVLITGASTGIGRAAALTLGRRGHRVVATMRDLSRGEALRAEVEQRPHLPHDARRDRRIVCCADVAAALRVWKQAPVAAGFHQGAALEETPIATFRALYETNTLGVVRCAQAVLPHLRERRAGSIVAVTSQSGRIVHPTNAAYCASKFAAEAALEALALEVAPFGIRVSIVEPGLTFAAAQEKFVPWPRGSAYQAFDRASRARATQLRVEHDSGSRRGRGRGAKLRRRARRQRNSPGARGSGEAARVARNQSARFSHAGDVMLDVD